jgi:ABC-type bacteriocin/lantibiotic exporter with double-glycine peptidase domain
MTAPVLLDLPYERQNVATHMCGAAALCMVYRSLDLACSQDDIWPAVSACGPSGAVRSRTYLLCADALRRGFAAVTLQVRQALGLLRAALEYEVRVIVLHRQSLNSRGGHYGVLVGMDEERLAIHDPWLGPKQWFDQAEWLKLWRPGEGNIEVRGNLAVFIAPRAAESPRCRLCEQVLPPQLPCPMCRKQIPLRPGVVLGCLDFNCPDRTWDLLFCPWCDAGLDRLK